MTRTERLADYLWNNQRRHFRYGMHDCGLFVARWVDKELGTDYEERVRDLVEEVGIRQVLLTINQPGGYIEVLAKMTGHDPGDGERWKSGDIAIFRQADGTATLGVLSKSLVHAPGPSSLFSTTASPSILLAHWDLECLRQ